MNQKEEFKQRQKDRLNQAIANHGDLVLLSTYNVIFINYLAVGLVIETFSELKKANLYRHQMKQLANAVMREQSIYERLVNRCVGESCAFLADANDLYVESIHHHINTLTYAIKAQLDKHSIPNSLFLATLETARVLCDAACFRMDYWISILRKADTALVKISSIDYLRITDLCTKINRMADEAYKVHQSIDLKADPLCKLAIDILTKKLSDDEITRKAALTNSNRESA